jgi:hypothetical protein
VGWQGVAVLVLLGGTIWALVRRPVLGFVGAWFFLILAPSSSFIPLITQTVAEHRMYLSLAAVIAGFGFGFVRRYGAWALWFLAVLIPVLAGATMARLADYRDAITIWTDTTTHAPNHIARHPFPIKPVSHRIFLMLAKLGLRALSQESAKSTFARCIGNSCYANQRNLANFNDCLVRKPPPPTRSPS